MNKNKKILIISESFYPEEFKINDIAIGFIKKGFSVDVLTLAPTYPLGKVYSGYNNFFFQKDNYKGINILRIKAVTGYIESTFKKKLKYINYMIIGSIIGIYIGKKYDFIFGYNMASLTDMLPAVLIRKIYKKPLLFWVQDVWPDSVYAYGFKKNIFLKFCLNKFVSFMYNNISNIAISSKGFESKLRPFIFKDLEFHYAPNWADELDMNLNPVCLSQSKKVQFNFSGNIGKVQNLENIIIAFSLLSHELQQKAQLNIIGDGSNLKNLIKIAKNNPNIIFHGKKDRHEMSKYYKASDFLIISLINEPIFSLTVPSKFQTYVAAKKPILAVINGEVADIVSEYNLGICADPINVNNIKEAYEKCIIMTKDDKAKFLVNNEQLLQETFNKEKIIDKLTRLLIASN